MSQYLFHKLLGEILLQSPNNFVPIQFVLGEHESSLYLRGDRVKYWDISIVIGKRDIYWGTARAHSFSNSRSLLGNRGLLEMLSGRI